MMLHITTKLVRGTGKKSVNFLASVCLFPRVTDHSTYRDLFGLLDPDPLVFLSV